MKKIQFLLIATILFSALAGCAPKGVTLSGTEREAVLAFSEAKTDNLLAGMNAYDYAAFSRDFDTEMLNAMTESEFNTLKVDRDTKLGLYISRTVNSVMQQGDFYIVIYDVKYEKDDAVIVRVVFRIAEPHQISGLWFNK